MKSKLAVLYLVFSSALAADLIRKVNLYGPLVLSFAFGVCIS